MGWDWKIRVKGKRDRRGRKGKNWKWGIKRGGAREVKRKNGVGT